MPNLTPDPENVSRTGTMDSTIHQIIEQTIATYLAQHPRPTQVNMQQACEMLGVSHPTLKKMLDKGEIRMNACGKIPITEIDRMLAPRDVRQAS